MHITNEELAGEWQRLTAAYAPAAADALRQLAEQESAELARYFYAQMLADPQSAMFLSHDQVKTRLSARCSAGSATCSARRTSPASSK